MPEWQNGADIRKAVEAAAERKAARQKADTAASNTKTEKKG